MKFKLVIDLSAAQGLDSTDVGAILQQVGEEIMEEQFGQGSGRIKYEEQMVGMWELEDATE